MTGIQGRGETFKKILKFKSESRLSSSTHVLDME